MSSLFIEQAKSYASYHLNPKTRLTHFIGVPLIVFSLMIFLGFFKLVMPSVFSTNLAWIASVVLLAYYFKLEWRLALSITPVLFVLLLISDLISANGPSTGSVWTFILLFLIGWGFQLGGHFIYEKNRPALLDNLWQMLIAPLFLVMEGYFYFGKMFNLQSEIYGSHKQSGNEKTDAEDKSDVASKRNDNH